MHERAVVFDVAIVGGGLIGLSCAWKLAQGGAKIALFERAELGQEASQAAAGMLAPVCEAVIHPLNASPSARRAMFELGCTSRDGYPAFATQLLKETGLDIELCLENSPTSDWRQPGIIFVAKTETDPRLDALLRLGARAKWRDFQAVSIASDGQVENRKLVIALRQAAQQSGVEIHENRPIRSLKTENGRVVGVSDSQNSFRADKILLCGGAWSSQIRGVPPEISASIRPVAGQMLQLRGKMLVNQVIYSDDCYLVPRRDGRLLVGATVEEIGFQKRVTAEAASQLLSAACQLVPELREAPLEAHWAGLRPTSRDGLPLLGATGVPGLFVATGHGRNGVLLTPITAHLIADLLLKNREIPADFSPARFA